MRTDIIKNDHHAGGRFYCFGDTSGFCGFSLWFCKFKLLIFIACLRSVGGGFQAPAVNALYPEIVPREHLLRINGINQMANNVLLLLSPAAPAALFWVCLGCSGLFSRSADGSYCHCHHVQAENSNKSSGQI